MALAWQKGNFSSFRTELAIPDIFFNSLSDNDLEKNKTWGDLFQPWQYYIVTLMLAADNANIADHSTIAIQYEIGGLTFNAGGQQSMIIPLPSPLKLCSAGNPSSCLLSVDEGGTPVPCSNFQVYSNSQSKISLLPNPSLNDGQPFTFNFNFLASYNRSQYATAADVVAAIGSTSDLIFEVYSGASRESLPFQVSIEESRVVEFESSDAGGCGVVESAATPISSPTPSPQQ